MPSDPSENVNFKVAVGKICPGRAGIWSPSNGKFSSVCCTELKTRILIGNLEINSRFVIRVGRSGVNDDVCHSLREVFFVALSFHHALCRVFGPLDGCS